jgi:hypothetical protein
MPVYLGMFENSLSGFIALVGISPNHRCGAAEPCTKGGCLANRSHEFGRIDYDYGSVGGLLNPAERSSLENLFDFPVVALR